ncbi:MAG: choice-of-anchor D domain-containing protein, partial [Calditrichaeota bacterium]|nr:choice-of-anchor D domain-containing protein [Calditrichota bacterium]
MLRVCKHSLKGLLLVFALLTLSGVSTAFDSARPAGEALRDDNASFQAVVGNDPADRPRRDRPAIRVEPGSLEDELITGQIRNYPFEISNAGDENLVWTATHRIVRQAMRDERERGWREVNDGGPQRDAAGDIVAQFAGPNVASQYWSPIGYDPQRNQMYITGYSANTVVVYTWDANTNYVNLREVRRMAATSPMDGAWYNNVIYVCNLSMNTNLYRFDANGNNVGNLVMPFATYGLAFDQDRGLMFAREHAGSYPIHVYLMDGVNRGAEIGQITNYSTYNGGNVSVYNLEWVWRHPQGQLWIVNNSTQQVYQILVNTANWQCVRTARNFPVACNQAYDPVCHDGLNLWAGGYQNANIRIYDDGVREVYWLDYNPQGGTIAAGESMNMVVTLNAISYIAGEYEADITIASNDPENERVVVNVLMTVEAAPDIDAVWGTLATPYGYPQEVNWNARYPDLFNNIDFPMAVTIRNIGVEELAVEGIDFDSDWLTVDREEFVLAPRASQTLTVTLRAPETGDHRFTMTVFSNDPDEREYEIALHANTGEPPVIIVNPASLEEDMHTGQIFARALSVTNDGEAPLRFTVTHTIINQQRDGNERGLRLADTGPRRDPAGQLVAQFAGPNVAGQYWSPVGFDPDNNAMFFNGYNASMCAVWTHDNYQNFRELRRFAMPSPMDGAWFNGAVYCNQHGQQTLRRFDINGNALQEVPAVGFTFYGVAIDQENSRIFYRNATVPYNIYVYRLLENGMRGDLVGQIGNYLQFTGNQAPYNLEWVWRHPEGQLWISQQSAQQLVQIQVNTDNWQAVREVRRFSNGGANTLYDACAHDGHHIWQAGQALANVRIYDDGVEELYWIGYAPKQGEVAGGESMEVMLTLNATGLVSGNYEADVHFRSNDPDNADVAVNVLLHIEGTTDIKVEWPAVYGYPDAIDWNRRYADLFTGGPYTMTVTVRNIGVEELAVDGIESDNDYFTADADQFVLNPREQRVVTLTVNVPADEPGDYNATLTIISDDPDGDYLIAMHALCRLPPEIVVRPGQIEDELFTGASAQHTLTVTNEGDAPLRYRLDHQIISEPGGDGSARALREVSGGPRRDAFGDVLGQFTWPFQQHGGLEFDGENFWGVTRLNNRQLFRFNPANGQALQVIQLNQTDIIGTGWDMVERVFWIAQYAAAGNRSRVFVVDRAGNQIRQFDGPSGGHIDFAFDRNFAYANAENDQTNPRIYKMNRQGQVIAVGPDIRALINHSRAISLEYVPAHREGRFWVLSTGYVSQLDIDFDNAQARVIREFRTTNDYAHNGLCHDGYNLYAGGNWSATTGYIHDDGIAETYWLDYEPTAGELVSDASDEITVTLNAEGLVGGGYEADIHFRSNDPANPDVAVNVLLNVEGAPDIAAAWPPAWGFTEDENAVLDWNRRYQDLFSGGPYTMTATVFNEGTAELVVDGVEIDHDYFRVQPNEFVLDPDASCNLTITFNAPADEPGEYNATMTIISNDPDEGEYNIALHARCSLPPIIVIDPQGIEDVLTNEEINESILNVANRGEAELRFTIEHDIIREPGDDDNARGLRSVGGPQRDPAGQLIAQFAGPNVAGQYCSPVGYDPDNNAMFFNGYNASFTAVWTWDNDYANPREIRRWANTNPMDGAWFNGAVYAGQHGQQNIRRYDINGNALQEVPAVGFTFYGIAIDQENQWLFLREQAGVNPIRVFQLLDNGMRGNLIGQITNYLQYIGNQVPYNLEWVWRHPDGQLWISQQSTQQLVQIQVNTENWQCVREVVRFANGGANQLYDACAHDGHNILQAGQALGNVRVYDDGVTEMYWLIYEPDEGRLQSGADMDIMVTLNAAGLI